MSALSRLARLERRRPEKSNTYVFAQTQAAAAAFYAKHKRLPTLADLHEVVAAAIAPRQGGHEMSRAAARLRALERRRPAKDSESEIPIRVVAWLDEGERPGLAMSGERRRRVDYRAGLHLIAPEGASHEIGE